MVRKHKKLEIGQGNGLIVRHEHLETGRFHEPVRLLFISDLHLAGWSGPLVADVLAKSAGAAPDHILMGGDYVDMRGGLAHLGLLVEGLAALAPVHAVAGNHDRFFGIGRIRDAVGRGHWKWIDGKSTAISEHIGVDGNRLHAAESESREPAVRILLAHNPALFDRLPENRYDLALAGHLHGGQWVAWQKGELLYPGAWFYKWNGLRFQHGRTRMLVSRGAADTIPIRYNCPREIILCEIH